jgi:hypothetical protein
VVHRTTTISRTTSLTTAPPIVFAVVNSPETAHLIDPAVREWSASSRPIGVGTQFTIRGHLGIIPIRGTSQVAVWDPPRLSEFRSVAPAWPIHMTARHRFEDRFDGGTVYTWSISFEEATVLARPFVAILSRLFSRAFGAQAEALESYLTQRPADDPEPPL